MAPSPIRAGPPRSRAMRIFSVLASAAVIALAFGIEPTPVARRHAVVAAGAAAGDVAGRCDAQRHRGAQDRREDARRDVAAICRRARPRLRALAARPHVCRRRRRGARRLSRVRIFPEVRRHPCRRKSGDPAGALRRQRLRGARPLLSRRHPQHGGAAEPRARAPDVCPCRVLLRRPRGAVPARPLYLDGNGVDARSQARGAAGSCSPPTRATTSRRRCSAASCSTASTACASARRA